MDNKFLTTKDKRSLKSFLTLTHEYTGLYYLFVPLTGIPVTHFKRTITGCKISKNLKLLYVSVKHTPSTFDTLIATHSSYLYVVRINEETFIVLNVQSQYIPTLQLMVDGRYTEVDDKIKTLICRESGLPYIVKSKVSGIKVHFLLQAFYEGNDVRKVLAISLNESIDDIPKELIIAIQEDSKMYIENCL